MCPPLAFLQLVSCPLSAVSMNLGVLLCSGHPVPLFPPLRLTALAFVHCPSLSLCSEMSVETHSPICS